MNWIKHCLLPALFLFLFRTGAMCQLDLLQPWSNSLYINFGAPSSTGQRLNASQTDLRFVPGPDLKPGEYTVLKSGNDYGNLYFPPLPFITYYSPGYKMKARYNGLVNPVNIFRDTIKNLCSGKRYLFWMGINNSDERSCLKPNLSITAERTTGELIESFQTGAMGGPLENDNFAWYPGLYDRSRFPVLPLDGGVIEVPFYGCSFTLPAGVTDVVLRVAYNPPAAGPPLQCEGEVTIDNIVLTALGPDIRILPKDDYGWIVGACYTGNVPVKLNGKILDSYRELGKPGFTPASYTQPAFQWEISYDTGYTWADIPGQNDINLSYLYTSPDTFFLRLRVSEAADIANKKCSNFSNLILAEVNDSLSDFSLSNNSPVCTGGELKFSFDGGTSYEIRGPNNYFDNISFPVIYNVQHIDSGWYYATAKSFGGCIAKDSTYVTVTGPDLKLSPDTTICYGEKITVKAAGGSSYTWEPAAGLSSPTASNPVASPDTTTRYKVTTKDMNGCNAVEYTTVTIKNKPLKAAFEAPVYACPNDAIVFADKSTGSIAAWSWDFGNGSLSGLPNPPAQRFPVSGRESRYRIKLAVTDSVGCNSAYQQEIISVNNCYIAVPSAFTPNNDGLNDYLYPVDAYKATQLKFRIFNRAGKLVFSADNFSQRWDGRVNGEMQDPGAYTWFLSYYDADKKYVALKGTSLLIR
ncbi:MAG: gliding motility-associated C-terminal domain-containing protein [Ferruginibacter sp.]